MTSEIPTPSPIRHVPTIAACLVALFGAAILAVSFRSAAGFDTHGLAWLVTADASAGAGFSLAGCALFIAALSVRAVVPRVLRVLIESTVLSIGVLMLFGYGLGVDVDVESRVADILHYDLRSAGREGMPALTALGFLLSGAALLFEHWKHVGGRAAARTLATLTCIVALSAMVGHLYGVPVLYAPFDGRAMSAPSAASFVVLGAGIGVLNPEYGLTGLAVRRTVLGAHVRWLFPIAVLVPLLIGGIGIVSFELFGIARLAIAVTAAGTAIGIGFVVGAAALLLRRVENRLEIANSALAAARQGVLIADGGKPGEPIVYVNDAFTVISGYTAKEALGKPCDFLAARPAVDAGELDKLAQGMRDGSSCTAIFRAQRKDKSIFSCRLSMSPVPGNDNRADHYIALLEDVTAEQLAAKTRLDLLADASQARKEAEAANKAREIFLASVTHDLRSPLNACLMWLDVMALGPLSEKAAKALDAIQRNLKLQARLVNDLIDAAKISSGGIEIHVESVDVSALIEQNLDTWRLMAASKGVEFRPVIEPGDYHVEADSERIVQVLNNLLQNGCDYTSEGGRVELRLQDEGRFVAICVEDTGSGLSETDLRGIFTPFWRGANTRDGPKGLGLGLAIAQHLVDSHEGTLSAASDGPGEGALFTVRLPRVMHRYVHRDGDRSVRPSGIGGAGG